ncbi:MAG: hypothetical protein M3238_07230 [Actinomycetota bacterium]|nr:hypothetical protein [Actinomycetota bacterium]
METKGVSFADRSDRGKLRFTGPQRAWFLHQILTQSFEDMEPGDSRDTALITAHGRMVGFMETVMTEDAILAHFEPELRDSLPDAIRRYIFATQVEVDDLSDEMGLVLVLGSNDLAPATDCVPHPTSSLGVPATYLWVTRDRLEDLIVELKDSGASEVSEQQLEVIRVTNAVPRWGREMDSKTIPQEVGIDRNAVHFDKGCYVGQEAMAKINFRGKVNRRLASLVGEGTIRPGADVVIGDDKVGTVTSVAEWGGLSHALAVVKHTVEAGARARAGSAKATVMT